ncbi:MAG: hypothetical protein RIR48_3113 [Bacteroidota bacterium]|jgi:hypothetical protein
MIQKILVFFIFFAALVSITNCAQKEQKVSATTVEVSKDSLIKKGEYLVTILGCNDCHSPKRMGANGPEIIPELMLSGYPSDRPFGKVSKDALADGWALFNGDLTAGVGPWGASFAGNLTSDPTGIGEWSLDQFKIALTQGKYKGMADGRPLLPPMPWFNYINMKHEDVEAIYTYLMSTKPVKNIVPAPITPDKL